MVLFFYLLIEKQLESALPLLATPPPHICRLLFFFTLFVFYTCKNIGNSAKCLICIDILFVYQSLLYKVNLGYQQGWARACLDLSLNPCKWICQKVGMVLGHSYKAEACHNPQLFIFTPLVLGMSWLTTSWWACSCGFRLGSKYVWAHHYLSTGIKSQKNHRFPTATK